MTEEIEPILEELDGELVEQGSAKSPSLPRITDKMIHDVLVWARNYGEIVSFASIDVRGRRWRIELPEPRLVGHRLFAPRASDVVPTVLMLTSREALVFGWGCAAGGIHDRREFAREKWGWE